MNELYWISRCAIVNEIAQIVIFGGLIAAGALGLWFLIFYLEYDFDSEKWKNIRPWFKGIAVVCSVATLFYAFVPSKEEMYLILGVGGTIDYIQSSDKAKQLPDKCIDAIDAWVESLNGEEEE